MEYLLDTTIVRDVDRLKAVEEILDHLNRTPKPKELEAFASYIMYGKDENGLNSIQRGEVKDFETKKFKDFKTGDDKTISLDSVMENPLINQQSIKPFNAKRVYLKKARTIKRPKYDKEGNMTDPGDSDIPGMVELWERIDQLEHTLAANEGKVEFNANDSVITSQPKLHNFRHMLIDVRRHQYYLKDFYKPVLEPHTLNFSNPLPMTWDEDTFYWISEEEWQRRIDNAFNPLISKDWTTYEKRKNPVTGETEVKWVVARHNFNWENVWHIKQLIRFYSDIYMEAYEKLNSWARTLIFDFDRYFELCAFTELRQYVLTRFIDGATLTTISEDVQRKYGVDYSNTALSNMINIEIPGRIADIALRERLMRETPDSERKFCTRCKRYLPASSLFFVANHSKARGLQSWCKECDRKYRIEKGFQGDKDARYKD